MTGIIKHNSLQYVEWRGEWCFDGICRHRAYCAVLKDHHAGKERRWQQVDFWNEMDHGEMSDRKPIFFPENACLVLFEVSL